MVIITCDYKALTWNIVLVWFFFLIFLLKEELKGALKKIIVEHADYQV